MKKNGNKRILEVLVDSNPYGITRLPLSKPVGKYNFIDHPWLIREFCLARNEIDKILKKGVK